MKKKSKIGNIAQIRPSKCQDVSFDFGSSQGLKIRTYKVKFIFISVSSQRYKSGFIYFHVAQTHLETMDIFPTVLKLNIIFSTIPFMLKVIDFVKKRDFILLNVYMIGK